MDHECIYMEQTDYIVTRMIIWHIHAIKLIMDWMDYMAMTRFGWIEWSTDVIRWIG